MSIGELKNSSRISVYHALLMGLLLFGANLTFAQGASAVAAAGAGVAAATEAKGDKKPDPKKDAANVAKGGTALKGSTNVKDNVNIQVVLLPRKQAKRVFSKEIADHYAVVQVIVDNKSEDAAFVLHSIFADYAGWALGGVPTSAQGNAALAASKKASGQSSTPDSTGATSAAEASGTSSAAGVPCPGDKDSLKAGAYQSVSCEGHVASVESRVIRGELQDASTWTWRNGLIRAAVLVGTVASGIPAFGSKNALKYVGAYNGQFIPGAQILFPDGTIPQINRVSDFGFQTNKIFAKGDSDIVYAFFPLDRFFTPGIKDIFLNAPAVFFAPAQLFVDTRMGKLQAHADEMKNLIEDLAVPPIAPLCDEYNTALAWQVGNITAIAAANGIVTLTVANTMKQGDVATLAGLNTNSGLNTGSTPPVSLTAATPMTISFASSAANIKNGVETGTVTTTGKACKAQKERDQEMLRRLTTRCDPDNKTDTTNIAACAAQQLLNQISLNSANILVQGVMTVNVDIVPATITDLTFDEGDHLTTTWTTGKDHPATMTGSFLTGGVPGVTSIEVPDTPNKPRTDIKDYLDAQKGISVVSDGSTDSTLHFKIQWKQTIPSGSKLHFQVTKTDAKDTKKTSGVKSMDYLYAVTYAGPAAATGSGDQSPPAGDANKTGAAGNDNQPVSEDKKKEP
jgi:hypothetical protein